MSRRGLFSFRFCSSLALVTATASLLTPVAAYPFTDIDEALADREEASQTNDLGASAQGETVSEAVNAALTFNPRIASARAQEKGARAERFRALGGFLPSVEGNASYAGEDFRSNRIDTLEDRDGLTLGLTVRQPIFEGLSTINAFREARANLAEARFSLADAHEQAALSAARAHASVVLARQIVDHRRNNLILIKKQFQITQARMKAGAQSRTGVEQARMRAATAGASLAQALADLASSEASYARAIGREAPSKLAADEDQSTFGFLSLSDALAAAERASPSVKAAEQQVKAARHAKNAAKGAFTPNFSVEGNFFRRLPEDSALDNEDEYQIVARMRAPIFVQGANIANMRQASATEQNQRALLREAKLSVEETVTRTWRSIVNGKARIAAAKKAIQAANLAVKGLQVEFEAGNRTVIDVLDGQRDLVNAEIDLSQAQFDLRAAQYELAATAGVLVSALSESDEMSKQDQSAELATTSIEIPPAQ